MTEFGLVIRGEMAANAAGDDMRVGAWPASTVSRAEIILSGGLSPTPECDGQFLCCDFSRSAPARRGRRRDP